MEEALRRQLCFIIFSKTINLRYTIVLCWGTNTFHRGTLTQKPVTELWESSRGTETHSVSIIVTHSHTCRRVCVHGAAEPEELASVKEKELQSQMCRYSSLSPMVWKTHFGFSLTCAGRRLLVFSTPSSCSYLPFPCLPLENLPPKVETSGQPILF